MKTSEKIFVTFYFILCAVITAFVSIEVVDYTKNHIYSTEAVVIATDNYEVYIETEDGNVWCFEDDRYNTDDVLTVYFDDNNTEEITDDEITKTTIKSN